MRQGQEVGVGAANPAGAVDFMLKRLGLSGLKATDTGHVDVSGLKEPAVHIAVDGFLTDFKPIGIVDRDVVDRLAALDERRDPFVKVEQFILGNVCAGAGLHQHFPVCLVGLFMEIILFAQNTLSLFHTAVADIRRVIKLDTQPLLKFLAYGVAVIATGTFSGAVGLVGAKLHLLADIELCAAVMDAVRRIFIAFYGASANFAGNGGGAFSKIDRNSLEGDTLP